MPTLTLGPRSENRPQLTLLDPHPVALCGVVPGEDARARALVAHA